jgi:hypothetical protein
VSAICISFLSACATVEPYTAVPPSETHKAIVLGLPNARLFPDHPQEIIAEQERALIREGRTLGVGRSGTLPTANLLSLSGGGLVGRMGGSWRPPNV